jgi:hypothetical protein
MLLREVVRSAAGWLDGVDGRRWLLRGLLAYAVIGFVVWIRRTGDFAGYLVVGDLVRSGGHIYHDAGVGVNTWPPFFSLLCAVLSWLAVPTPYLARGLWLLLNYASVLLAMHLIARLLYDRPLSLRANSAGMSLAAPVLLVPLVLTERFVSGNFSHLQVNVVIFALSLAGLYVQRRAHEVAGSLLLGGAAALKVMPLVFIPYLAYRGRWRAATWTTAFTVLFSLSPILVFGWRRFWDYVAAWRAVIAVGWEVGNMNQSMFAMWDRVLGHGLSPVAATGVHQLAASGASAARVAVILSLAVVTLLALFVFRRHTAWERWGAAAEWSVAFIVSALFAPVTWKPFLTVLLLPNALLFAAWRCPALDSATRWTAGGFLIAGSALALLSSRVLTFAALVLLGGSLWLRARLP